MHTTCPPKASLTAWCLACCLTLSGLASAAESKPRLSMTAAKEIALGKETGKVKSQELEKEKGRWIYSFDIERDKQVHEVNVDANTGEIIEDSVESAADEANERADKKKR
jgi:hypothetical protein